MPDAIQSIRSDFRPRRSVELHPLPPPTPPFAKRGIRKRHRTSLVQNVASDAQFTSVAFTETVGPEPEGHAIAKGFLRPVTAPDAIGKGIPCKKWCKYDLSRHCWPQDEDRKGPLKIPQAPPHWVRTRRGEQNENQKTSVAVPLSSRHHGPEGPLWSLKDVFRVKVEVNVRQGNAIQALPAGALVVVARDSTGDTMQLVSDSDAEIHLGRSVLAPLEGDVRKTCISYLRALPRGRKAPFGVLLPFCASELHFKQAIYVAHAGGIHLEGGWLTYEIACAHAASQLYPSRCESWLANVVSHAMSLGLPIEELFPSIAHSSKFEHMLPQPLGSLDKLPDGGASPCLHALQQEVVALHAKIKKGETDTHVKSLQKYVENVEEITAPSALDSKTRGKVLPCEVWTHTLHNNGSGTHYGFCSYTVFKKFTKDIASIFGKSGGKIEVAKPSILSKTENVEAELKGVNLDILLKNIDKIETTYLDLLLPSLPDMNVVLDKLRPIVERIEMDHAAVWKGESSHDLKVAESVAFTTSMEWKQTQYTGDVTTLYRTAWTMVPTLYMFAHQMMAIFATEPKVQIKVQHLRGRMDKLFKIDKEAYAQRDFTRVHDILLGICTFTSLPFLAAVAEFVDQNLGPSSTHARRKDIMKRLGLPANVQDLDIRLVVGKNRFADQVTGGSRCMKLLFSLSGFIAELRLEYSHCSDVRARHGKRAMNWVKLFKTAAIVYVGESKVEEDDITGDRSWLRNGFGAEEDLEGNLYVGQWVMDKKHGWATVWEANKSIYQGDFVKGVRKGQGTIWQTDGTVLQGTFDRENLKGTSIMWFENGAVEVMDHHKQLRAIFNKDRTKATLELLSLDKHLPSSADIGKIGQGKQPDAASPGSEKSSKRKNQQTQNVCEEIKGTEEACSQLGIERGEPKKEVTTWEACHILEIDEVPSLQPPAVEKLRIPKVFTSQMIKQKQKPGIPGFNTTELNVMENLGVFEEEFGIHWSGP